MQARIVAANNATGMTSTANPSTTPAPPTTRIFPAQRNRWYTGDRAMRMRAVASDFHFYDMMATRGYDRMTLDKCINDNALAERLAAISAASDKLGVDHTPSFTLNGQLLVGTNGWDLLEPQIAARL